LKNRENTGYTRVERFERPTFVNELKCCSTNGDVTEHEAD